jgi:hypothetical protein
MFNLYCMGTGHLNPRITGLLAGLHVSCITWTIKVIGVLLILSEVIDGI